MRGQRRCVARAWRLIFTKHRDPHHTHIGRAASARGVHISTKPDLEATDPSFYGRGHQGEEYPLVRRSGGADRTYFYTGPEGTVVPEDAVMGSIGGEMRKGPRYAYEAQLDGAFADEPGAAAWLAGHLAAPSLESSPSPPPAQ